MDNNYNNYNTNNVPDDYEYEYLSYAVIREVEMGVLSSWSDGEKHDYLRSENNLRFLTSRIVEKVVGNFKMKSGAFHKIS